MPAAIAAGHEKTTEAARHILEAGGNIFDAALAAMCAACVVEPVLASLGGGGFLLAREANGQTRLYDFFAQTPHQRRPLDQLDFQPIEADFGQVRQTFHIGMGAIAVPGVVRGLFAAHRELGHIPMKTILEPAIDYARQGTLITPQQAYIFSVVAPIYLFSDSARNLYGREHGSRLPLAGEWLYQPQLADALEALEREGDHLFYEGELADLISQQCAERGGQITRRDLSAYQCLERQPLRQPYRNHEFLTNPAPSAGGPLIAFSLALLSEHTFERGAWGSSNHLSTLAQVMARTDKVRESLLHPDGERHEQLLENYRHHLRQSSLRSRGTTHISLVDDAGNAAALTLSNGEGCGHLLPDTGIMLNNILGEEDLNPQGLHCWPTDIRLASMMAPSMLLGPNQLLVIGSGGSNRLRNAILQTLINIADFDLPIAEAVAAPRIHLEGGLLNLEPGFTSETQAALAENYPNRHQWDTLNLFFGGTHSVMLRQAQLDGAGDPRRAGAFLLYNH